MNARDVVAQRITTLDGLLAAPSGPFAGRGGPLADQLSEGWRAERRLLQRILDETQGGDVRATIGLWNERTAAFLERSAEGAASWHDRDGHVWNAADALRILEDLTRRIESWLAETGRLDLGAAARGAAAPGPGPGPAAGTPVETKAPGVSHASALGDGDPADDDLDDEVLRFDPDEDEDDDEDDDARYVRVNDPTAPR